MSVGRPREFDSDAVIHTAMLSFWHKGYEACSLSELIDATGLSKSSLYQSFGSKKQLFLTTLAHYCEIETKAMLDKLGESDTALQFFEDLVDSFCSKTIHHWNSGCLVANTAAELGQSDPEIAIALKSAIDLFTECFVVALSQGLEDGSICIDRFSLDEVASYLLISFNGLRTMVKAGMSERHIVQAGKMILRAL